MFEQLSLSFHLPGVAIMTWYYDCYYLWWSDHYKDIIIIWSSRKNWVAGLHSHILTNEPRIHRHWQITGITRGKNVLNSWKAPKGLHISFCAIWCWFVVHLHITLSSIIAILFKNMHHRSIKLTEMLIIWMVDFDRGLLHQTRLRYLLISIMLNFLTFEFDLIKLQQTNRHTMNTTPRGQRTTVCFTSSVIQLSL